MAANEANGAVGQVFMVRRDQIRRFKDNPRKKFDLEELGQLALSIKRIGQRTAIKVRRLTEKEQRENPGCEYEIVDGERRYRACAMIGKETMKAQIEEYQDGETSQFLDSVIANICRSDHSPMEVAFALERMTKSKDEGGEGMSVEEAAEALGHSKPWAYQHLNLLRLTPELQRRMHADVPPSKRISFQLGLKLSRLPRRAQKEVVSQTASRNGLGHKNLLAHADRVIDRMGLAPTLGRPRKERNDFLVITQAVQSTFKMLNPLMDLHSDDFIRAFCPPRDPRHHASVVELLEKIEWVAKGLKDTIRKIASRIR